MPTMESHHASEIQKILLVADPGGGKTGSLATVINEKQVDEMFILDFDNGLDVLAQYLKPELRSKVHYETLTDKMTPMPDGPPACFNATALPRAMKLLDRWKSGEGDFGKLIDWRPDKLLVVDSLTMLGSAAMHYVKCLNKQPTERDWGFYGQAMEIEEKLLELLYSTSVGCNVIMTAHIVPIAPRKQVEKPNQAGEMKVQSVETGEPKNYPSALGNKLPPKVGRFFNAVLRVRSEGSGSGLRRFIETVSDDEIELKNPAPLSVPRRIPLDGPLGGLGEYFRIVRAVARGEK